MSITRENEPDTFVLGVVQRAKPRGATKSTGPKGLRDPTKGPLVIGSGRVATRAVGGIGWAQQVGLCLPVAGIAGID
jgi:hypothetical protein